MSDSDLPSIVSQAVAEAERVAREDGGSLGASATYDLPTQTMTVQADADVTWRGWAAKVWARYVRAPGREDASAGAEVRKRWFGGW